MSGRDPRLGPVSLDPTLARFRRALRRSDRRHLYLLVLERPADAPNTIDLIQAERPAAPLRLLSAADGIDALAAPQEGAAVTVLDLTLDGGRPELVRELLQRFNERRNLVMERLGGELVILLTPSQERMAIMACAP